MEQDIISIISTLGFPIFMSLWLMLRTEKVINNNTVALQRNTETILTCPHRR